VLCNKLSLCKAFNFTAYGIENTINTPLLRA
jgi:hypothetical protein